MQTPPPRSRAADRPWHRAPAPRSWVPWSGFRGSRRSTRPPSRTSLRAAAGARPTPNLRGSAARSDVGCGCPRAANEVSRPYKSARCTPPAAPTATPPAPLLGLPSFWGLVFKIFRNIFYRKFFSPNPYLKRLISDEKFIAALQKSHFPASGLRHPLLTLVDWAKVPERC